MMAMRYRIVLLAGWLVFFYNLERASKFISYQRIDLLTPYAYVFMALVVLITLALPAIHRLPLLISSSVVVFTFLVTKAWLGYPLWGQALPLTVTEVCAFLITGLLARQVIWAIQEFESSIVNFTIRHIGRHPKSFAIEQGEMYQEVRRAREFNRPLTLMAIKPEVNSFEVATEKMVEEVQRVTMRQYVLAALAKAVEDQLGPYSVIAQNGNKFLVLLPETSKEDFSRLLGQLRGYVQESIGLELQIGSSSMPEVETFDELVEVACSEMKGQMRQEPEEVVTPGLSSAPGQTASEVERAFS